MSLYPDDRHISLFVSFFIVLFPSVASLSVIPFAMFCHYSYLPFLVFRSYRYLVVFVISQLIKIAGLRRVHSLPFNYCYSYLYSFVSFPLSSALFIFLSLFIAISLLITSILYFLSLFLVTSLLCSFHLHFVASFPCISAIVYAASPSHGNLLIARCHSRRLFLVSTSCYERPASVHRHRMREKGMPRELYQRFYQLLDSRSSNTYDLPETSLGKAASQLTTHPKGRTQPSTKTLYSHTAG